MPSQSQFAALAVALLASACADAGPVPIDTEAELAGIEATRSEFMAIMAEKRYEDLGAIVTRDLIAVPPGSGEWDAMRARGAELGVPFPYDSIRMLPMETVLASDSVAWDMGTSRVYYTDANGVSHELRDTYLAILKKGQDGAWRLHREVASSLVE